MCLVAKGSLDGTVHIGRVPRRTDIAASILIVREAGGEVLALDNDGSMYPLSIDGEWDRIVGVASLGDPSIAPGLFPRWHALDVPGLDKGDKT